MTPRPMFVLVALLSLAGGGQLPAVEPEPSCAGNTPEETWSNAIAAFEAEDLGRLTECLDREPVMRNIGVLLGTSSQMIQAFGLTMAEEGSPEYEEVVSRVRAAEERLLEILRAHDLPTTAEDANALSAEDRAARMNAIDAAVMYPELIQFIESLDESGATRSPRERYFTQGSFEHALERLEIDGDTARGSAFGAVEMVRVDGLWYLVPPT